MVEDLAINRTLETSTNDSQPPNPAILSENLTSSTQGNQPKRRFVIIFNLMLGIIALIALGMLMVWFFISRSNLLPKQTTNWNGIIPGQTTKTEVISKLGKPVEEKQELFGSLMTYDSGIESLPNTVIYDQNTGKVTSTLVTISNDDQAKKDYEEMQKIGKPEKIMFSNYLQFSKIYIFAQKGIAYSADETTKTVDAIHYFQPTDLNTYLTKFGQYFTETNEYIF